MFKNLITRALSGFLFVIILISSILYSPYSFAAVFALIAALATSEFHKMTRNESTSINRWIGAVGAALLFSCSYIFVSAQPSFPVYPIYGIYVVLVFVSELFLKKKNPINNWANFVLGQLYVALPFSLLNFILFIHGWQPSILLAVFITIWVNDTGAYLSGISFGKHKMFERVSPKKSWEGFVGGAVAALISGYIFSIYLPQMSLLSWLGFSEMIVIFGTLGDLIESLIKRTVNVKDSGNMIPGHGGLLDRFDSMILAAPVIFIYLSYIFLF